MIKLHYLCLWLVDHWSYTLCIRAYILIRIYNSEVVQIRKSDVSFDTKTEGDIQIVNISGQLDAFTVSNLKSEFKKLTDAHSIKFILNLGKVDYANSTAIGAIVAVAQQVRKRKGDIKLCGMNDDIRKVFDLVGASKILEIFKSEQEALKSFS